MHLRVFPLRQCVFVCLGGWDASQIPLTAPDDSCAASLFIWTDATEPLVQLAQPLCSRARHCGVPPLSISQTRLSGKTLSKSCSITEQARLIFHEKNLAKCLIYKSQINLRLLSWGHVWALCIFQPDKSGVVTVSLDFQNCQKNIHPKVFGLLFGTRRKNSERSPIKGNLRFNHAYNVKFKKRCFFFFFPPVSCRSGTSHRHRVCLQSICWVQGRRPTGSSTERRTQPTHSGD